MVTIIHTASKVPVFGVLLVCIFPHSDWIRRDTEYLSVLSPNAGKYGQGNSEYGQFSRSDTFFFSFSTSKTVLQLFPTKKCHLIKFLLLNSKKAYFLIFHISKAWKPFLHFKPFHATGLFSPWKYQKSSGYLVISGRYRNRPVTWNGLMFYGIKPLVKPWEN